MTIKKLIYYNEDYYKNNRQDKDRLGLVFYKNVIKYYFHPETFLDYGCGKGHFLNKISKIQSIKNTFGYDLSKYARTKAKKNSKNSVIIDKLDKIKNNSIDFISALHVIEHINDDKLREMLRSFKRILKVDGTILFATPAVDGFAHKIKKKIWIGLNDKTHINLKNYQEWIQFFKRNDLNLVISSNDGLWDFPYLTKKFVFKFFQIFLIMIIQIFFGKLILQPNEGETFIFILKFK